MQRGCLAINHDVLGAWFAAAAATGWSLAGQMQRLHVSCSTMLVRCQVNNSGVMYGNTSRSSDGVRLQCSGLCPAAASNDHLFAGTVDNRASSSACADTPVSNSVQTQHNLSRSRVLRARCVTQPNSSRNSAEPAGDTATAAMFMYCEERDWV
jgi:hypothetical protein